MSNRHDKAARQALIDRIAGDIAEGLTLCRICAGPDRPSLAELFAWLADDEGHTLRGAIARARAFRADLLTEEMLDLIRATSDNAALLKVRIDALKWIIGQARILSDEAAGPSQPIVIERRLVAPQMEEA